MVVWIQITALFAISDLTINGLTGFVDPTTVFAPGDSFIYTFPAPNEELSIDILLVGGSPLAADDVTCAGTVPSGMCYFLGVK